MVGIGDVFDVPAEMFAHGDEVIVWLGLEGLFEEASVIEGNVDQAMAEGQSGRPIWAGTTGLLFALKDKRIAITGTANQHAVEAVGSGAVFAIDARGDVAVAQDQRRECFGKFGGAADGIPIGLAAVALAQRTTVEAYRHRLRIQQARDPVIYGGGVVANAGLDADGDGAALAIGRRQLCVQIGHMARKARRTAVYRWPSSHRCTNPVRPLSWPG